MKPEENTDATIFTQAIFTGAAGGQLDWKVFCDNLRRADWAWAAWQAVKLVGQFSRVEGVPTGGDRFAAALEQYIIPDAQRILIVDDVMTTGMSMERQRGQRDAVGVVLFNRSPHCPMWVYPIWNINWRLA